MGKVKQLNSSALLVGASIVQSVDTYHISSHTPLPMSSCKANNNMLSKPYEQDFDPLSDYHKHLHESPLTTSLHTLNLNTSDKASKGFTV